MQFEFLATRRDALPLLGRWYHREWGRRFSNETEAESTAKLERYLNIDQIPFILLATEHSEVVGAAQLKYREMANLFPEKEHWLGGVFVSPEHRGRGVAAELIQHIISMAPSYDVTTLYLQTEQLNGGLYTRLGWHPIKQLNNHGLEVLVMERCIGA